MSGGPPHHPHNRPMPTGNTAWNHLQVPNFFPRQPQHAHMSSEHPIIHQPTWHTPTTEPLKTTLQHSHILNLEQMLSERPFMKQSPGVDLSFSRSSSQNGDISSAPISLSVRDTNKINSLAASALERQGEITPHSPLVKATSPPAPTAKKKSPTPEKQLSPKIKKVKRVNSILERLNPQITENDGEKAPTPTPTNVAVTNPATTNSNSHDENSNSSSILNVPTPREDDVVSPYSNEDSLDSNKSRRKRKPSKTMKVTKEAEVPPMPENLFPGKTTLNAHSNNISTPLVPERQKSTSPMSHDSTNIRKSRRKTSSEDETIDKIAAMVGSIVQDDKEPTNIPAVATTTASSSTSTTMVTLAQKKDFVAVEDKLEEMFAGLEDTKDSQPTNTLEDISIGFNNTAELLDLAESTPSTSQVSSTSNDVGRKKPLRKKRKFKGKTNEGSKKRKPGKSDLKKQLSSPKKVNGKAKQESLKDVYAYDSGSNASSSKSRGPFVHISGPRDSPTSVCVVNAPIHDDDGDFKKNHKTKKFHDDSEFRQKVRSKGLHCSTLSHKYDAQTRDSTWICVFCKRGPYSSEFAHNNVYYTPGDLFGPYIITTKCGEFNRRMDDPYDKNFKSKKIARTLDAARPGKKGGKRKITESYDDKDHELGITKMDDVNYEVWAHEDCVVWAPGINLVGAKIVGLEEAVWSASNVSCSRCSSKGANICCIKRGCTNVMHLGCAYIARWNLDTENYKAFCAEHTVST